jgi:hypothetical protein
MEEPEYLDPYHDIPYTSRTPSESSFPGVPRSQAVDTSVQAIDSEHDREELRRGEGSFSTSRHQEDGAFHDDAAFDQPLEHEIGDHGENDSSEGTDEFNEEETISNEIIAGEIPVEVEEIEAEDLSDGSGKPKTQEEEEEEEPRIDDDELRDQRLIERCMTRLEKKWPEHSAVIITDDLPENKLEEDTPIHIQQRIFGLIGRNPDTEPFSLNEVIHLLSRIQLPWSQGFFTFRYFVLFIQARVVGVRCFIVPIPDAVLF